MREEKNTRRSTVYIGFDGRVHKVFRGHEAEERFNNEVKVLKYLETRGCDFVPRLLDYDPDSLKIITSNAGKKVEVLSDEKIDEIFNELEGYGVRHDDRIDEPVRDEEHKSCETVRFEHDGTHQMIYDASV